MVGLPIRLDHLGCVCCIGLFHIRLASDTKLDWLTWTKQDKNSEAFGIVLD